AVLLRPGRGDILLMRLAFMEVRAMVCFPQETYPRFRFPIFARADSPAFESRDEHARLRTAPREDAMQSKLDASILSYDGKHFVRTETTLMNEGKSAIGTKLDRDSA